MVDWKSYKGQAPFGLVKSSNKPRYNEGSSIATSDDPTWNANDFTGEPITPGHDPCGYWPTEPIPEPPSPDPVIDFTASFNNQTGTYLVWAGEFGGAYGRFIVTDVGDIMRYSDDGGETWTNCVKPFLWGSSTTPPRIAYAQATETFFFPWVDNASSTSSIYKSIDGGINWTVTVTVAISVLFYNVRYMPYWGRYIALQKKQFGTYHRFAVSVDLVTWTYPGHEVTSQIPWTLHVRDHLCWLASPAVNGYCYLGTDASTWALLPWPYPVFMTYPSVVDYNVVFASAGAYLYISNAVYQQYATEWIESGITFTRLVEHPTYGYVRTYSTGGYSYVEYNTDFLSSTTWQLLLRTRDGFVTATNDLCWGSHHCLGVAAGVNGYCMTCFFTSTIPPTPQATVTTVPTKTNTLKWLSYKGQVPWTI